MRCGRFPLGGFFILVGFLFLLSHILPVTINVWRMIWPLMIIFWGLRLVLGERKRPLPPQPSPQQNSNEVHYLSLPIKQVEEAHIRLKHDGGKLEIHGDTAPDELLAGTFGTAGVAYEVERAVDDVLHLHLQTASPAHRPDEHHWKFGLNHEIPMSLSLNTKASHGILDLSTLRLAEIRLQSGASELTVMLPAKAARTLVHVESGAAAIKLYIPEGVAAHIRAKEGVTAVQVDEWRFPKIGNVYESEDYDEATNRIDIHINSGANNIAII